MKLQTILHLHLFPWNEYKRMHKDEMQNYTAETELSINIHMLFIQDNAEGMVSQPEQSSQDWKMKTNPFFREGERINKKREIPGLNLQSTPVHLKSPLFLHWENFSISFLHGESDLQSVMAPQATKFLKLWLNHQLIWFLLFTHGKMKICFKITSQYYTTDFYPIQTLPSLQICPVTTSDN